MIFVTFLETKIFSLQRIGRYTISLIFLKNAENAKNTGFPLHDRNKDWFGG